MQRKSIWQFLKTTIDEWVEAEPFQLAAALSYYTLFSLAPLLLIAIGVAGFVFGREAAQNQIVETLQGMIGQESATTVQEMIQASNEKPKTGMISTIIGFVALLFGAGGVVGQLQTSLNKIWEVTPKPGQGIWGFIRQRFFSFAMVLSIGFLLLVSLVVTAVLSSFTGMLSSLLGDATFVAHAIDIVVSFGFVTLLFALIYKYVPDVEIEWRDVWVGAALTAILFTVGKYLIGLYIGTSGVSSTFGAAGSLITILVWVYYSSLIFFLGAEFTRVYATQYGSGVAPAENAQQMDAAPQSANA
ncbi:MAG TPA: YihY/virulence factor BrkB family protein [Candidatus Binatia bacterium]|nr:YihY/virulence factor BrkB family protein [Candidatus Binatia bacterium]